MSDPEPPELRDLVEELFDVKKKWYSIGLQLKVPDAKLDEIEHTCKDDLARALRLVLQEWRNQIGPRPTWAGVVKALRTRTVNEQDLAANLEDRFASTARQATSQQLEQIDVASVTSRSTALAALNSVVLMRTDGVPDPDVQGEIDHLYQAFETLRMDVFNYLDKTKPDLKEFSVFVSSPPPAWKTKRPKPMTDVNLDCIMNPETEFYQMFCIVSQYTSWYNYELLKKIINRYGDPDLRRKMEEYCTGLSEFESRTSAEVLKNIAFCRPQSDSVTIIANLPDHHCNQFTGSDIRKLKHALTDEAGTDPATLRTYMIHESSVEIIFLVPISLAPYLIVSSVCPLLASQGPLPENVYERCVHLVHVEEVFRLMGRTVTPPPPRKSNSTQQILPARPLFRSVFSSESLTSEMSRITEESVSLYPSFDPGRIQIFHDKVLQNGDNAVVCKAQFLHLPCAAKYVHQKLTESSSWQLENFLKGCKILESCRHPNIVTFLGMHSDTSLAMPILLMELMDQSLKEFLERAERVIPLHVQLDICYDVAQGLEYLHAKNIIHGDLMATNVLIREGRAKISGVMSLQHNTMDGELSQCPGSPECLPMRSISFSDYDEAIDCFSFGVLAIHIATRQMPKPHAMALQSSESSEVERYEHSLSKVNPKHLLYPIIFKCLNDEPSKRPSAAKLCCEFSDMRESSGYRTSQKAERVATELAGLQIKHLQGVVGKQNDENEQLRSQLEDKQVEIQQQGEEFRQLQHQRDHAESKLQKVQHDKEEMKNTMKKLTCSNKDFEEKIGAASKEIEKYKSELEGMKHCRTELNDVVAEKEKMCRDLWVEREKTGSMESKITELETAKVNLKTQLEASDKACAELMQREQQAN